jgi:hypothetical protein
MSKPDTGKYKKNLKKAYDFENKAFKQWDKSNFLNAGNDFKEAANYFEKANQYSETLDQKILTSSNMHVELSNHYWVLGLRKYSDEENYNEASELFKNAIVNKKKALDLDKGDLQIRKEKGGSSEAKRQEWRIYQQSTLMELYAYYFLSNGLLAEQKKKYKKALENFENAAANYKQQIRYLKSVKKPFYLVRQFLLKTRLRIGEVKRILGKTKDSIQIYKSVTREINSMNKRYRNRCLAILALAEAELAEAHKDLDEIESADKFYWRFLNWAKKIKLDKEQAQEVARVICIVTIMNIKLNKANEVNKAIQEFKAGKIFGKNLREAENNPWYKLASIISEFYEKSDINIFKEAKLVYNKMIDKKDKFVTKFFEEENQ